MTITIEIANALTGSTTDKGNLLENLAKDLLKAQSYEVTQNVRVTAAELDLLCTHKVSGKEIYVECKAQKAPINGPILRQLWGTVDSSEYAEGWIISTSEFGKDAKGFASDWKKKDKKKSERLSFYTPDLVIDALERANVICKPPYERALDLVRNPDLMGAWTLIVTPFGRFWAVYVLTGGVGDKALVFSTKTGKLVSDDGILKSFIGLDSAIAHCDLSIAKSLSADPTAARNSTSPIASVVEVQTGDSWDDYRPARSKDFIGRKEYLSEIFSFFQDVQTGKTSTRVFSITGNSGLGKSSLIAQIREKSRNKSYKNRYFVFAVDMRGARSASYIAASLLAGLQAAQAAGFGGAAKLKVSNPDLPLSDRSVQEFLDRLDTNQQVVSLVFDQFEELYSKPDLYPVFEAAKNLMLEVASLKSCLCLGFAWKTDFTSQGDHPAYHMWHSLSDHRKNYKLDIFSPGETSASLTLFEKQIGQKIRSDLRHQIATSSQGFPWLLKKLCINLYEGLKKGGAQGGFDGALNIAKLFESDIDQLTPQEHTCLKLIAERAPADWSEIIDAAGLTALTGLTNKRLVVRSGDRLNIYWDIFKDYVVSGKTPTLPLNYIPTNEFSTLARCAKALSNSCTTSSTILQQTLKLSESTIQNVGADLVMLGIAERSNSSLKLAEHVSAASEGDLLEKLRERFDSHAVKLEIYRLPSGSVVETTAIVDALRAVLPKANHGAKTWNTYANRLARYLSLVGFLVPKGKQWIVKDIGGPVPNSAALAGRKKLSGVFAPLSSPTSALETLSSILDGGQQGSAFLSHNRNAIAVLRRFQLVTVNGSSVSANRAAIRRAGGISEALWIAAKNEETLMRCVDYLQQNVEASAQELGSYISNAHDLSWVDASTLRYGNVLRQWSKWLVETFNRMQVSSLVARSSGNVRS